MKDEQNGRSDEGFSQSHGFVHMLFTIVSIKSFPSALKPSLATNTRSSEPAMDKICSVLNFLWSLL